MDLELPRTWPAARERLFPVLRSVTTPEHAARAESGGSRLVRRPFAPLLRTLLALDLEYVRLYVTERHLDQWGVDENTAFNTALDALEPGAGLRVSDDGLWELAAGDGYDSSRLVLPGWLATFRPRMRGAPVAVAPHARRLVVADSADPQQILSLLALGARAWQHDGDPISPAPYSLDRAGRVVPWEPPDTVPEPIRASVRASVRAFAGREYGRQRAILADRPLAPHEVGLGPASSDGIRLAYTFTRWVRGSDAWLAEADFVVLVDPDAGPLLAVPWTAVADHLDRVPDVEPTRFRPRDWPEGDRWHRLRTYAVDPDTLA